MPDNEKAGDLPDSGELLDVMREAVEAATAFTELNPGALEITGRPGEQRWMEAFAAQRRMIAEIDATLAAFRSSIPGA